MDRDEEHDERDDAATSAGGDVVDDLGIGADIAALVAAVEAESSDFFDDELMDPDEVELGDVAGEIRTPATELVASKGSPNHPPDGVEGALELDDADYEELELEPEPLSLYLDVDGTIVEVDRDEFVIGRAAKMCDFAIVDVNISRQHCAIERRADGYYVVDRGSINGIKLDGQRIDDYRLSDGDVLELAGHAISVSFGPPKALEATQDGDDVGANRGPTQSQPGVASDGSEGRRTAGDRPAAAPTSAELQTTAPYEAVGAHEPTDKPGETPPRLQAITVIPTNAPPSFAPAPAPAQGALPPNSAHQDFEQRVEARLDQLSQQVAYLQQCMQSLMTSFDQLHDVIAVARAIRARVEARRKQPGRR